MQRMEVVHATTSQATTLLSSSLLSIVIPAASGQIPHLTPDMLAHLRAAHSRLFLSIPLADIPALGPVHTVLNHPAESTTIIVTDRDPLTAARGTSTGGWPDPQQTTQLIRTVLRPDEFVQPCDAISIHVGNNRANLSRERGELGRVSAGASASLWAVTGKDARGVEASVKAAAAGTRGVYIDVGSSALATRALELLRPSGLPLVVADGLAGPHRLLDLFVQGAALVETAYAELQARLGYASCYQTARVLARRATAVHMDSRNRAWMTSRAPLVEGCACFTCAHHTRAYVRHLVETKEMLGETLLMAHNLHCMLDLARSATAAKREGTLDAWVREWREWHA